MEQTAIRQLAANQPEMRALDQAFYTDADVYQAEIEKIFMKVWLYAGHVSEIPRVGDWFLYELDTESVIIIRSAKDRITALLNVCRHRGSRVCVESHGRSKRLTCLYHGWTYDMEGRLRAAAHMGEGFDKSDIALKSVHCRVLAGMIYINFADSPAPLDDAVRELSDCLAPYDLANARVAHRQSYPIEANWKLSVENYCECYHCAPSHPEYSRGHALADPDERHAEAYARVFETARACGVVGEQCNRKFMRSRGFGSDYLYEHYPLLRNHLTGSRDGQPVAPLMGSIKDYFGGCSDFQVGPVTFGLAYCDHVVIYAFKPLSHHRSDCDITWLVRGDAEPGRDYDVEELTWLWDVTTHADKRIIERNAQGVASRFYVPGPLSDMEDYTADFMGWYTRTISE